MLGETQMNYFHKLVLDFVILEREIYLRLITFVFLSDVQILTLPIFHLDWGFML
jgi:hypothetical protein